MNRFFREILRDAAKELKDQELVQRFKSNAGYGNALASLVSVYLTWLCISPSLILRTQVKGRFSKYRMAIWGVAQVEAKLVYRLASETPGLDKKVRDLLYNDAFVYGIDAASVRDFGSLRFGI